MRMFIKGGTWKNHEDEILKAAVMKYGKNQWARIASLLPRKSAKQCKARWYEWLDPSIKKTEWTREEEEKLLHLAKLMPCQWLTIAPIVGRTPHQCLEHYEKLLDQVQERGEDFDPADDPRRLRPGEIDPHPEVKPPRPDALDMDDDEKEMLNEARARLANTKGKKAKRKAREKQLDEARRLAALQKRRELKAAGIDIPMKGRRRRGIDYAREIPFWKQVPSGFFDTTEELARKPQHDGAFRNLDPQRRDAVSRDEKERIERERDRKKQALKKKEALPDHFDKVNKLNDPSGMVRRSELVLPQPQVTDRVLEQLHKLGPETVAQLQQERRAIGERTPATADSVALLARDQAAMQSMQTPLAGGETPMTSDCYRDFDGLRPQRAEQPTPNLMRAQATPRTGQHGGGMTPGGTPVRDALRINDAGDLTPSMTPSGIYHHASRSAREQRLAEKIERAQVEASLRTLPRPSDDVEIQPQLTPQQLASLQAGEQTDTVAPDQAEVRLSRKRAREEAREQARERQTQAVRRCLPRPAVVASDREASAPDAARALLDREIQLLAAHDAHAHPAPGARPAARPRVPLDDVPPKLLALAAAELRREEDVLKGRSALFTQDESGALRLADPELLSEERALCDRDYVFLPNPPRALHKRQCTAAERLEAAQHEFEVARHTTAQAAEEASALERKVGVLTAGYQRRMQSLQEDAERSWAEGNKLEMTLRSFQQLRQIEQLAIQSRIARLQSEVAEQKERESRLQSEYAAARRDHSDLAERLAAPGPPQPAAVGRP
eukprot:TRINITY_DN49880_c0_g1_i1.p1 TRINITY_DN49880_c0_g1~~TRINITY_DN49880_c0_g1_i1.p1  ORF type:complete len:815 (+),score=317.83 TRINITY_DN49880_c0_g1_i1:97-2445(+)